jgi:copper(I)-binding protein
MRENRSTLRSIAVVASLALALASCGGDDAASESAGEIAVADAWSRQPVSGQPTTAVYAVVSNPTNADITIVAASSPITDRVELHETVENDDGTMTMREMDDGFVVPAGGDFTFESGGPHIMLFDIDADTYPTDQVEITLDFDGADSITFDAEVRTLDGDTMGSMDMDSSDMDSSDMDSMDM